MDEDPSPMTEPMPDAPDGADAFCLMMGEIEAAAVLALDDLARHLHRHFGDRLEPAMLTGPYSRAVGIVSRAAAGRLSPELANLLEEALVAHLRGGFRDAVTPIQADGTPWQFRPSGHA